MAVAVKVYKRETKELSLTSREERGPWAGCAGKRRCFRG
jgi:hypothetical protein